MIVSGAAPPMVDALRRVRRCMFRRVFCRFCHARSRVPIEFGPFLYCAFCERAAPDAPETIDDQRRSTRCRDRAISGGSRGSASLPMLPAAPETIDDQRRSRDVVIGQSRRLARERVPTNAAGRAGNHRRSERVLFSVRTLLATPGRVHTP